MGLIKNVFQQQLMCGEEMYLLSYKLPKSSHNMHFTVLSSHQGCSKYSANIPDVSGFKIGSNNRKIREPGKH